MGFFKKDIEPKISDRESQQYNYDNRYYDNSQQNNYDDRYYSNQNYNYNNQDYNNSQNEKQSLKIKFGSKRPKIKRNAQKDNKTNKLNNFNSEG